MRADALRDNTAWRQLVASVVRRGIEQGLQWPTRPERSPCSPWPPPTDGHPAVARRPESARGAVHDVLAALPSCCAL
jgi:hypothetical protein